MSTTSAAERSSLTTSSAAAAILEAAEAAAHPQDGGWKRSTRRRKAKQFRRSTSCPSVALLAYLRTQRAAVDAAVDREQQRQPEENAVFLPSFPDPDVDGDHGGPPQEALDWEREHKGEADSRARLSYPQPPAIRIDIGDGLPAASAHYVRRSTSAARAPGLHAHQRPASSDNRVWLVRHHPDEGHDYAEFALGEGDDDDDHEREDDERSEWMQVALEREQLERERADLFEVVRMWRDREEEHLTKEAKARRALKLLLQVNDNIEDDMRRRSYCGGGPPQRSRAIINDMEAEERRGDRRLSLVVEVLTRMAREQLEGNLLGFIRNSIDNTNTTSGAGAGHNKKPFAYVGTGHATSRYTHSRGASGHILDHSRFHYDPEEERHKAKKLGAKLNHHHHHHQQHEPEQHQKKKSRHQQRNRQARAEAETKEAHDGRVGFSRARRFSTKQRYLEHLAATHYSHGGDDSDRRAVSMRNFKRPSLFAVVGGGGGQGQPVDSRRRAAVLQRRERMDRVASVATFDRRGRVDLLASANTDDEGDEGAEQLMEEEQHAKKELSDAVDAIVAVADQLAADESVEGPATTPMTTKKMMTASSEAVQRRKLMKRCLTDEIMNILRDSNDSDGMDSSASACGSVPRVRLSKSEEMTRPVASPQRRNVIWRDHNVDDVDSNDSVDGLPQNLSTLAELAGHGSPVKRHPKAEVARPSRRESAEERRSRKQLAKKRAKLQRREMKKLEKRAKKEEKKRARVWMREVKDLKRQLRLQKKKRNKQPDDDVDSSSQEVVAERLDEASAGKVGSSGAKKHSHFFGKLRRKKDHPKKKNEDDVDTKNKNEDGDEEEEIAVSPRQQRRRAFKSVSLRAMRKKDSTTPDHNALTDEAAAEETTGAGAGGGRLVSFWRKRPHSKKAKDTVLPQPQPQLQPGATAENDENETPTSSVNARLPMDALLANSRQTGSSAVGITEHDGDNDKYEAVEVEVDCDEGDEIEEEQLIEEDEDEEDELEEWERGKGKEVEQQQQQLYEDAEEEEVRVAEDKSTAKEEEEGEEQEEWRPAAIVPVATLNVRQTEAEIRYSVAVQAMGQPLFGESLARLIENQRLEEKMLGIPTLAVPRVMYILCRALLQRSAAAGNMEGLFRVSGSSVEVKRLQEQLELRDYDVCAFDCYAIASCMEAWLSQLPEPIIPEEFYNDCVKNANRPDQSLLIIDRIPEINKCVVWCICEFVRRITQPKQVIKTMMNAHNLAIVFAPSLLRCGDQAIMFYLSTFEVMFVQNLFQSYANLGVPLISLD